MWDKVMWTKPPKKIMDSMTKDWQYYAMISYTILYSTLPGSFTVRSLAVVLAGVWVLGVSWRSEGTREDARPREPPRSGGARVRTRANRCGPRRTPCRTALRAPAVAAASH